MTRLSKLAIGLAALAFLALASLLTAQSSSAQNDQSNATAGRTASPPLQILVTGCLKRGNEAGEYSLADQNGTIWKLTSTTVNLAEHVNHSVSVGGKPVVPPKQPENNASGGQTESKPQPTLRVLTLKMLSNSCTR
jgi:hypothetical protein